MSTQALRTSGFLGPEFNEFLYEPIGLDLSGRPLSVVSALARLDLDAWDEAARLARLPKHIAIETLSGMIRKFTECPQAVKDSQNIAVRLVALLPGGPALPRPAGAAPMAGAPAKNPVVSMAVFIALLALVLGMHLLGPRMQEAAAPVPVPVHGTTRP